VCPPHEFFDHLASFNPAVPANVVQCTKMHKFAQNGFVYSAASSAAYSRRARRRFRAEIDRVCTPPHSPDHNGRSSSQCILRNLHIHLIHTPARRTGIRMLCGVESTVATEIGVASDGQGGAIGNQALSGSTGTNGQAPLQTS